QRVRIRKRAGRIRIQIVVLRAIQDVVGGVRSPSVHRYGRYARIGGSGGDTGVGVRRDADDQAHELRGVAAVQGQLLDALLVNNGFERGRAGVDNRRRSGHRHRFGRAAEVELDVHAHDLVDLYADRLRFEFLEAGRLGGDIVDPDGNAANPVDSLAVRTRGE